MGSVKLAQKPTRFFPLGFSPGYLDPRGKGTLAARLGDLGERGGGRGYPNLADLNPPPSQTASFPFPATSHPATHPPPLTLTCGAGRQALRMASELECRWVYLGSCRMGCMLNACLLFMDIMVAAAAAARKNQKRRAGGRSSSAPRLIVSDRALRHPQ